MHPGQEYPKPLWLRPPCLSAQGREQQRNRARQSLAVHRPVRDADVAPTPDAARTLPWVESATASRPPRRWGPCLGAPKPR
eukprot:scaffold3795_cov105-Pinguiococcus_pyrenoidosus.AAC.1